MFSWEANKSAWRPPCLVFGWQLKTDSHFYLVDMLKLYLGFNFNGSLIQWDKIHMYEGSFYSNIPSNHRDEIQ